MTASACPTTARATGWRAAATRAVDGTAADRRGDRAVAPTSRTTWWPAKLAPLFLQRWLSNQEPKLIIVGHIERSWSANDRSPQKPDEPGGVMTASNAELQQRKNAATPRGVGVMCDFYAERALNAELWDIEGR